MSRWEVDLGYVQPWLKQLDMDSHDQVIAAMDALSIGGPMLGRPLVDTVHGSSFANMKELRPGSAGESELRVLFAFDPWRRAIMLVGGDKRGEWNSWYRMNIPRADQLFRDHVTTLREGCDTWE